MVHDKIKYVYTEKDFLDLFQEKIEDKLIKTFKYMFYKFKKGIFVKIKKNIITHYIFFDNLDFKNNWYNIIKLNNNINSKDEVKKFIIFSELYSKYWYIKKKYNNLNCSLEQYISKNTNKIDINKFNLEVSKWYANNGLFRYDKQCIKDEKNVIVFYDMIKELLKKFIIQDKFFFLNKRDFPIIFENNKEPYYNIFGVNEEIFDYKSTELCDIFSMSIKDNFKDILLPTFEDWYRIRSLESVLFPPIYKNYNYNFEYNWNKKINKFVFRGSSTGEGYNNLNNKRLNLIEKKEKSKFNNLIDAGITKWQLRPRIKNKKFYFINPENYNNYLNNNLSPEEQSKYKYIINIEGNVSAFRLSLELCMKSCILIVESEWKLWYSDKLKPYIHYIPIKSDLSDLDDIIEWCIKNEKVCKNIAENSYIFSNEILSKNSILDYLYKKLN